MMSNCKSNTRVPVMRLSSNALNFDLTSTLSASCFAGANVSGRYESIGSIARGIEKRSVSRRGGEVQDALVMPFAGTSSPSLCLLAGFKTSFSVAKENVFSLSRRAHNRGRHLQKLFLRKRMPRHPRHENRSLEVIYFVDADTCG